MRKQIIIGAAVSGVLHAGFVFAGNLFPNEAKIPAAPSDKKVEIWIAPTIKPDPVDVVEPVKPINDPVRSPVPSIPDDPVNPRIDTPFVQPIEPPMPNGEPINPNVIPVNISGPSGNEFHGVVDWKDVQRKPEAVSQGRAVYPIEMINSHTEGSATIAFIVTTNGEVADAHVVGSTNREFERPAVEAVSRWKFRAGVKDNHAVNTRMVVEIKFTLDN